MTTMPTIQTSATPTAQQYNGPQAGVYNMRAVEADLGFTAGNDQEAPKPQVGVLLEFVDGPYKGTSLTWYGFFTEKTRAGTIRSLRTLGWQGNDVSVLDTVRGEAPCTIQVEPDLDGVARARVRFVGGGALAMKSLMNEDQKKAFAMSMQSFAASIAASPTTQTNGTPPGAVGPTGQKFF